jgi:hypothetical protein
VGMAGRKIFFEDDADDFIFAGGVVNNNWLVEAIGVQKGRT